jgi:FkbM family methyltransferase
MSRILKKLRNFGRLCKFGRWLPDAHFRGSVRPTFSQTGEDSIILFILTVLKIANPSYIDIGAFDPFVLNNTARMYYWEGGRGINIEPNPEMYARLQKFRKHDLNLNIGISNKKGTLKYYVMDAPTLNTFSEEEARSLSAKWGKKIVKTLEIPVDTIDNVIKAYANNQYPDFLNIDAEGTEMDIVERIDFSASRPKIICLETIEYTETGIPKTSTAVVDFLCQNGYFVFAHTHINTILVLEELWANR